MYPYNTRLLIELQVELVHGFLACLLSSAGTPSPFPGAFETQDKPTFVPWLGVWSLLL